MLYRLGYNRSDGGISSAEVPSSQVCLGLCQVDKSCDWIIKVYSGVIKFKNRDFGTKLKNIFIKAKLQRAEVLQLCGGVLAYFLQGLGVNPQDK